MFVVVVGGGLLFVPGGTITSILGALTIAAGIAGLTRDLSPRKPPAHAVEDAGKQFDTERE